MFCSIGDRFDYFLLSSVFISFILYSCLFINLYSTNCPDERLNILLIKLLNLLGQLKNSFMSNGLIGVSQSSEVVWLKDSCF